MRIVVDTNVIVSALVFGGLPKKILDLVAQDTHQLYFSTSIKNEVERVLEEKFGWGREQIRERVGVVLGWGTKIDPLLSLAVVKDDPDDDRILECATAAEAHVIVSGDRHLLRLGYFRSIRVQTPRQFLEAAEKLL